jgi:uncharacterized protein
MGRVGIVDRVGGVALLALALVAPSALNTANAPFTVLTPVFAQQLPPELTKPVNDFANVVDAESEAEIERRILELKQASGDIVVVATVDTFQPYGDVREYAVKMFENHGRGIGDKGKDNGLLIVLAVKDRRVQVEVGYDLEQFVTDGYAGEVSRNDMVPYFERGEYGRGLLTGVARIIGRIAQGRGVTLGSVPLGRPESPGMSVSPWVIVAIIIFIMLMNSGGGRRSRMRRGSPYWGGGTWSGWNSGVGPFGGGGRIGGGGFGGGFGGFGGGRSGGGGGGAGW